MLARKIRDLGKKIKIWANFFPIPATGLIKSKISTEILAHLLSGPENNSPQQASAGL